MKSPGQETINFIHGLLANFETSGDVQSTMIRLVHKYIPGVDVSFHNGTTPEIYHPNNIVTYPLQCFDGNAHFRHPPHLPEKALIALIERIAFNQIQRQKRISENDLQTQRLKAIFHDLRNDLSLVAGFLEISHSHLTKKPEDTEQDLGIATELASNLIVALEEILRVKSTKCPPDTTDRGVLDNHDGLPVNLQTSLLEEAITALERIENRTIFLTALVTPTEEKEDRNGESEELFREIGIPEIQRTITIDHRGAKVGYIIMAFRESLHEIIRICNKTQKHPDINADLAEYLGICLGRTKKILDFSDLSEKEEEIDLEDFLLNILAEARIDFPSINFTFQSNYSGKSSLFPTSLQRIFANLFTNADKHAQCNAVEVAVQKNVDSLSILVQDNGKGFGETDPQELKKFGKQGEDAAPGYGIGLSCVSDICKKNGWVFDLGNNASKPGAFFKITIPHNTASVVDQMT